MKIILNLDNDTWKRLGVLAKLRNHEPAVLAENLLAQLLTQQMQKTDDKVGNTADIAEVLATRLLAIDKSGNQIKNAMSELSMLDDTAHTKVVMGRLQQTLKQNGLDHGSKIYKAQ